MPTQHHNTVTQAVILAAGFGSRLAKYTRNEPKAFLPIKYGTSIIARMLGQLLARGVRNVVVVIGYKEERAREYIEQLRVAFPDITIRIARNADFATTGSLQSLVAGFEMLPDQNDDFLIVEGDVVCDAEILDLAVGARPNTLLVDRGAALDDEAMRITLRAEDIVAINKTIPEGETDGEYFGIARVSGADFGAIMLPYAREVMAEHPQAFFEEVVERLAKESVGRGRFRAVDVGDLRWTEIDFPEEYKTAREIFAEAVPVSFDPRLFTETSHSPSPFALVRDLDIRIEDFCFLANPYIANGSLMERVRMELPTLMAVYPPIQRQLRETVANFFDDRLPPEALLVGNGATELINVLGARHGRPIVPVPTYSEYMETAANPIPYFLREDRDFAIDFDHLVSFIRNQPDATSLVVITPNNPAGPGLDPDQVFELARIFPKLRLIIDECFIEFDGKHRSVLPKLLDHPEIVVVKSFGKVLGVPGLRLGVMAAHPDTLRGYESGVPIWNVNTLAAYVLEMLREPAFRKEYEESIVQVRKDTVVLYEGLSRLACCEKVYKPGGNFVLVKLAPSITATELRDILLQDRIYIRDCTNKIGLGPQFARIASRKADENRHLIQYLQALVTDHEHKQVEPRTRELAFAGRP